MSETGSGVLCESYDFEDEGCIASSEYGTVMQVARASIEP